MKCQYCDKTCSKNGFQNNGTQRYRCGHCKKHQQKSYQYLACAPRITEKICKLTTNGCGIRDIARILQISRNTVGKHLLKKARSLKHNFILEHGGEYEMDEIHIKVNTQRICIAYAINRKTRRVIDFIVGRKTKVNLQKVVNSLLLLNPSKIFTDRLNIYPSIIPKAIHKSQRYCTNRIERFNLTLRTHLKRLTRKTLCYTKKIKYLQAVLKIYFWSLDRQLNL